MKLFKNLLIVFLFIFLFTNSAFAAKFSKEMTSFIKEQFPSSELRFDGLITLKDGTLYLPLYPALIKTPDKIEVKEVISVNKDSEYPEIIILNNDFVFMKVIKNSQNKKSLLSLKNPPMEVKTGLLPQDLLVPSELYIPENIKGIMGNLKIPTIEDNGLKIEATAPEKKVIKRQVKILTDSSVISDLKDKVFYIVTNESKDIQVVKSGNKNAEYALEQSNIVYDVKATPDNKFLLVTNFDKPFVDVISLADDMRIKQIDLTTNGGEILIDEKKNKAYISSPQASMLYVLDLNTMTLTQKIKLKGKCIRLALVDNNRKIFYYNQYNNEIWSVELDNDYITKYIGSFPNISKIEYANGKVYLLSRVAGRLACVDYETLNLMTEMPVNEKPIDMINYKNNIYILSAQNNTVQILDVFRDEIIDCINLNTEGFSTGIYKYGQYAIITDAMSGVYSVINIETNKFIKNVPINLLINKLVITPEIRKN